MAQYIIWSPQSKLPSQKVFESKNDAIKVAYKMAIEHQEQVYYVAKLVGVAMMRKAEYENLEE